MSRNKKPRNKKPRGKKSNIKSAMRLLKGTIMKWSVDDPLGDDDEILNSKIDHANPHAKLMLKEISQIMQGVVTQMYLKWKITLEIEFVDQYGKKYFRGADLVLWGRLNEMDDHYQKTVEEIFTVANMDQYVTTHLRAEILGNSPIKESDFENKLDEVG